MGRIVSVARLDSAGKYILIPDAPFEDVFLCRLQIPGLVPAGAVPIGKGHAVLAFSRKCTHLGCYLVATLAVGDLPPDGLIRCKCHASCFDLTAEGLVVVGPATDWLPQVELRPADEPLTKVELVRWIRDRSVPYGVPFAGTSANPPERPA
jgi:nitrite reductase/ring-hydroxylating ferredoxin subunit